MKDLTIIYYTSNWLDTHNPYFLANTKKQLLEAAKGLPIISVSQKPMGFGTNICVGNMKICQCENGVSSGFLYRSYIIIFYFKNSLRSFCRAIIHE